MKRWRISAKKQKLYKKSKDNAKYRNTVSKMKKSYNGLKTRLGINEENNEFDLLTEINQGET